MLLKFASIKLMIAYIKGEVIQKNERSIILLTNGIGYEVFLINNDLENIEKGKNCELNIYSHIKEDMFDLYGFKDIEQLDFFKKIISISGIGPKSALNILSLADIHDLKRAISSEDSSFLQTVSGIGKKTAARIVLELKEKIVTEISDQEIQKQGSGQVIEALISLGYKETDARDAAKKVPDDIQELSEKIKIALKEVNK